MLQERVKFLNPDVVSKAYYEWREAANAWSTFYCSLKQDRGQASLEQRKRLRALEKQLSKASDRYVQIRMINKYKRVSLA